MGTFGENLRRERELRGITLPELSNATKISLRHLDALENDEFDRLPGGVFNRGFVRAIARYLNLDEHHWVGEFVRAAHEEPDILARYAPPNSAAAQASARRGVWSLALLVVVFGVGAYIVHQARLRRPADVAPVVVAAPGSASQPASSSVRPTAAPLEPASSAETAPRVPAANGEASSPAWSRPASDELRLQVDALEDAWVSVTVDGQPLYARVMKPGETRSFRGRARIELTTGNASAVILTLNGETLPPLGNPGERKNVTLTAQDLKAPTR